jgi:hypothetical protein
VIAAKEFRTHRTDSNFLEPKEARSSGKMIIEDIYDVFLSSPSVVLDFSYNVMIHTEILALCAKGWPNLQRFFNNYNE